MPKFRITGPDGDKYDIDAPEGASDQEVMGFAFSQMSQSMSPGELQVARSKNDEMGAYLRSQAEAPRDGETEDQRFKRLYGGLGQPEVGVGEGMLRSGLQGGTFGYGDEIVAAGAAGVDAMTDPNKNFSDSYDSRLYNERAKLRTFSDEHPYLSAGAEIAGAIPTAVLAAPASMPASLMGRMLVGAGTGTAQGALYGSGKGEGGSDRLSKALQTGALSGAIGGAAPVVMGGVRNVLDRVQAGRNARSLGTTPAAARVLLRGAEADDLLSGQGAQNIQRAGPDAMLADAGPGMRGILDTAMQTSGPAATQGRRAVEQRAARAGTTFKSALDDALGQPEGITRTTTALRRGSAPARSAAYDSAYSTPIDYSGGPGSEVLNLVQSRVPPAVVRRANNLMRIEGEQSQQILFNIADDGTVAFQRLPDVRQVDYITRALQETADMQSAKGALGGTTQTGRAYGNLKTELRILMREAVPEYGVALDTAADPISKRSALEVGRKALSTGTARDEFAEQIAGMSVAERQYVAQGVRSQLDDAMANVQRALTDVTMDAREAIKAARVLLTRSSRQKIEALIGEERAGVLFDRIDESMSAFELRAGVVANSRTFGRTATNDVIRDQAEEGVINAARMGEPLNAGKNLVRAVAGRSSADKTRMGDETYSSLVDALTRPSGQALGLVRTLSEQQGAPVPLETTRRLAERLLRANAGVTGPVANQ